MSSSVKEIYKTIVETQTDALCLWLPDTTLTYVNPAYCSLFKKSKDELLGSKWLDLIPDTIRNKIENYYSELVKTPKKNKFEHEILNAEGELRFFEWVDYPLFNEKQELIEFHSVGRDITDRKKLEKNKKNTEKKLIAALEEANQAYSLLQTHQKKMFESSKLTGLGILVSGLVHEISNPNKLIHLNDELLKEYWKYYKKILLEYNNPSYKIGTMQLSDVIADTERILNTISSGSNQIQSIIENLKEFAMTNVSEIKDYHSLKELIDKAYLICGGLVRNKSVKVEINVQDNLLYCNLIKIEQAIINLLTNAADAVENKQNGIVKIESYLTDNDIIEVCISDNGIGIKPENINKVFNPFYTTKTGQGGIGLGLSVVWGIIKEHHGDISVLSNEDHGSLFYIQFPIKGEEILIKNNRVLIVDESKELLDTIKNELIKEGIKSETLNNPLDTLKYLDKNKYIDFVITDLNMKQVSCYEVMSMLKNKYQWIKFICITDDNISPDNIQKLFELGVKASFTKSDISFNRLSNIIKQLRGIKYY